jgi:hypothetical protein
MDDSTEGGTAPLAPRIATVDSDHWHAVVLIAHDGIECVGFKRRAARDRWLDWYASSIRQFFRSLPVHF